MAERLTAGEFAESALAATARGGAALQASDVVIARSVGLGSGGFSNVFLGLLLGKQVAVKELKMPPNQDEALTVVRAIKEEVAMQASTQAPSATAPYLSLHAPPPRIIPPYSIKSLDSRPCVEGSSIGHLFVDY